MASTADAPRGAPPSTASQHQTELLDTEVAAAALKKTWIGLGIDPAELIVHEGTIIPDASSYNPSSTGAGADTAVAPARDDTEAAGAAPTRHPDDEAHLPLPPLPELLGAVDDPTSHLAIGSPLGQGGMGIVSLGTQVPLVRNVAVKALRDDRTNERTARALLREAYVLGALEHPNIVPVYLLGRDAKGLPIIVMKRIHGTPWSDYVEEGVAIPEGAGAAQRDALEWHLDVLMQVCNAVSFAHAKGIVHRDIKPSNVMIGEYGEVYLFDWGIAVAVRDDLPFDIRLARTVNKVAGTPGFMAPEMAACEGEKIDARTDVYLLGATLHTILTGRPRHSGADMINVMVSAYRSAPVDYGPDVPPELAAIANKATRPEPKDRFESAEELRKAIAEFIVRRHSGALTREAAARLDQLAERLARNVEGDRLEIYNLFSESRFAFRQALREWPGNEQAERGLQSALEQMAAYELDQGSWKVASMFIAELPKKNPELERRLSNVRDRRMSEKIRLVELEKMQKDVDVTVGMDVRGKMLALMGVVFGSVYPLLGQLADREIFDAKHGTFFVINLIYGAYLAIGMFVFRDVLKQSIVNRRYVGVLWIAFVGPLVLWPMAYLCEVDYRFGMAGVLLIYFLTGLAMAAATEARLVWAGVPFGLAAVGVAWSVAVDAGWHFEIMGVGVFFALEGFALLWRPPSEVAPGAGAAAAAATAGPGRAA